MKSSQERRLEALFETYEAGVQAIADEVRAKYLIPFCDKHDLRFVAGMGSWVFIDRAGTYLFEATEYGGDDWNIREDPIGFLWSGEGTTRYRCKRLLHLLNTCPAGYEQGLGSLMSDYRPGEGEKSS